MQAFKMRITVPDEQQLRKEQKRLNEKELPDEKGPRNEEP